MTREYTDRAIAVICTDRELVPGYRLRTDYQAIVEKYRADSAIMTTSDDLKKVRMIDQDALLTLSFGRRRKK